MSELFELIQDAGLAVFGEGELFTYHVAGGAAAGGSDVDDVEGIYRDAHAVLEASNLEETVSTSSPRLDVQWTQVAAAAPEPEALADFVTRKKTGARYQVVDWLPDGEGMIELVLHAEV